MSRSATASWASTSRGSGGRGRARRLRGRAPARARAGAPARVRRGHPRRAGSRRGRARRPRRLARSRRPRSRRTPRRAGAAAPARRRRPRRPAASAPSTATVPVTPFWAATCSSWANTSRTCCSGHRAGEQRHGLAAHEGDDHRDRLGAEALRELRVGIDIHLGEHEAPAELEDDLLEDRAQLLARPAPFGPQVDDDRNGARELEHLAERGVRDVQHERGDGCRGRAAARARRAPGARRRRTVAEC